MYALSIKVTLKVKRNSFETVSHQLNSVGYNLVSFLLGDNFLKCAL